jgi:spermidine synthase
MGGTLPALARHAVSDPRGIAGPLGLLYGVNTLGAAAGAFLGGLFLLETLGVLATGLSAAALAAGVGTLAIVVDRPVPTTSPPASAKRAVEMRPVATAERRACLVATALGGAAVLGYEVVWTRLLSLCLRSYAYSFSVMLGLFLLGLVLGALAVWRLAPRISDPLHTLAWLQIAIGLWVASSLLWMPGLLTPPEQASGFGAFLLAAAWRAVPIVLPPTILSGMALPIAVRVFASSRETIGREVGVVYAANTLGAIVGALAAGLALLPALGAPRALAVLATIHALSGAQIFAVTSSSRGRRPAPAIACAACLAALLLPSRPFVDGFLAASRGREAIGELLAFHEGATDTVAVVRKNYGFRDPDAKSVIVNGIAMTATVKPVWRYMAAEGHLPVLLAPRRERALVICVGTGITLGAVAAHDDVRTIDAVDLSEGVLASLPLFAAENARAAEDQRVRLLQADGRHFLETTDARYSIVTVEPPPPIVAGSAHLYTLDFYRLCRKRLEPGGIVAQWLPLHAQSLASARLAARTFLEAFPYVQLWLPSIRDAVLIGSDRPIELPVERLRAAYASARTKASLEAAYLETPEALLGTYLLDRQGIERWCDGAELVTDDRPRMEFFRRLGANMKDAEIGTLLQSPAGDLAWVRGLADDPAFAERVATERHALALYLKSEIADDLGAAKEAARTSLGTRFFQYRFGCDTPQVEALRKESGGGAKFEGHVRSCGQLTGLADPH